MSLAIIFVTVLTLLMLLTMWGLYLLGKEFQKTVWQMLIQQNDRLTTLTNLAAAKDLTAFASLQSLTQQISNPSFSNVDPNFVARDDVSTAAMIAKNYETNGIDPSRAFADELNITDEFGGFSGGGHIF